MAGNSEIIDSVVDPVALKQFADLQAASDAATASMVDTLQAATNLNKVLGSSSNGGFSKAAKDTTDAIDKISVAENKYLVLLSKEQAMRDSMEAKAAAAAQKESSRQQKAISDSQKKADADQRATDKTSASLATQNRAFVQLNQRYQEAIKNAKDIGAAQGASSQAFLDATENANKLGKQVDAINQPLGDFKNKVGGYANGITSAFSGAFGVIRQIAYILPGIGIAGIFSLIGNGIADLLRDTKLFTTQLGELFEKQEAVNAAFKTSDYKTAVSDILDLSANLELAKQGFLDKDKVIDQYNNLLGDTAGHVDTLDQAEQGLVKNKDKFIQANLEKAAALIILNKAADDAADIAEKNAKLQEGIVSNQQKIKDLQAAGKPAFQSGTAGDAGDPIAQAEANISSNQKEIDANNKKLQTSLTQRQNIVEQLRKSLTGAFGSGAIAGIGTKAGGISDIEKQGTDISNKLLEQQKALQQATIDNDKLSYSTRIAAATKYAELDSQIAKNNETLQLSDKKLSNNQRLEAESEYSNQVLTITNTRNKQIQSLNEQAEKDRQARIKAQLDAQKSSSKNTIDDPNADFSDRLDAIKNYIAVSTQLLKLSEKEQLADTGDNSENRKAIQIEYNKGITDLENERIAETLKINQEATTKLKAIFAEGLKYQEVIEQNAITQAKEDGDARQLIIEKNKSDAIAALASQYAAGLIGEQDFQQKRQDIENQANQDSLQSQIDAAKQVIAIRTALLTFGIGSAKDLGKAEDDLTKLEIQKSKLSTDQQVADANRVAQAKQNLHAKEQELAEKAFDLVKTLGDAAFQNQIDNLTKQSQQISDNADAEKKAVEGSIASSATKARQEAIIDAQTKQRQDQIAKETAQLKKKQAEFDKAISIARIIEETAVAIVSVLSIPVYGEALAIVNGAIGAAELATVVATPIPAYKHGGFTRPGLSIWGEAGTEAAIEPSGRVSISDGATLSRFPVGTEIISNRELAKHIRPDSSRYVGGQQVPWNEVISAIKSQKLESKRPVVVFKGVDQGLLKRMKR